jgi:hypothetical protein
MRVSKNGRRCSRAYCLTPINEYSIDSASAITFCYLEN